MLPAPVLYSFNPCTPCTPLYLHCRMRVPPPTALPERLPMLPKMHSPHLFAMHNPLTCSPCTFLSSFPPHLLCRRPSLQCSGHLFPMHPPHITTAEGPLCAPQFLYSRMCAPYTSSSHLRCRGPLHAFPRTCSPLHPCSLIHAFLTVTAEVPLVLPFPCVLPKHSLFTCQEIAWR